MEISNNIISKANIKAVVFGHAIADALGVPVEFVKREKLVLNPVTDMRGFGTYPYPAGCWSDDTSMALCALDALANGECNYDLVMVNFGRWYYNNEFTPTGEMFDVGTTCSYSIDNYFAYHKPVDQCGLSDEDSNGNGSLMRIYPFVLYLLAKDKNITTNNISLIFEASDLTHSHMRSKIGCGIYAFILEAILKEQNSDAVYKGLQKAAEMFCDEAEFLYYRRLYSPDFAKLPCNEIQSSGYVVHTLEAALWCLLSTSSYSECVLKAVNLGEDTDTVAAVAGSLAGALCGYDGIPEEWIKALKKNTYIENVCDRAFNAWKEYSELGGKIMNERVLKFAFEAAFRDATLNGAFIPDPKGDIQTVKDIAWEPVKDYFANSKNINGNGEYCNTRELIVKVANEFATYNNMDNRRNNSVSQFLYGNSQKLVNMLFKYLYIGIFLTPAKKDIFTNCDCPIDSIIIDKLIEEILRTPNLKDTYDKCISLEIATYKRGDKKGQPLTNDVGRKYFRKKGTNDGIAWSRITPAEYVEIQNLLQQWAKSFTPELTPIELDYEVW